MKPLIWSIKEFVEMCQSRVQNEFDNNCLVTGWTGLGKSTLINKILLRMPGFKQKKHQVYSRTDTIRLLQDYKFSYCWNDELVSAAFKRHHYEKEQIDLIETLTKYRCNYNMFFGALPVFFTLDKELIKLFAVNIDIIGRGKAVIHMRLGGRRYSDDPWDVKINAKLEEKFSKARQKNPDYKIPYHKYTTFVGYLFFNDATPKQKAIYEAIRDEKKAKIEAEKNIENTPENISFYEKLLDMLVKGNMDLEQLQNICTLNNKNILYVRTRLNKLLKQKGNPSRVKGLLKVPLNISQKNEQVLQELNDLTST